MSGGRGAAESACLRRLRFADAFFCWRLANDPLVRAVSFSDEAPTARGHLRWLWNWRTASDRFAWVIRVGRRRGGLVRVKHDRGEAVLSIALMRWARGLGIGPRAIAAASGLVVLRWNVPVAAYIKPDNRASVAAFAKAGYVETPQDGRSGVIRMIWSLNVERAAAKRKD